MKTPNQNDPRSMPFCLRCAVLAKMYSVAALILISLLPGALKSQAASFHLSATDASVRQPSTIQKILGVNRVGCSGLRIHEPGPKQVI